MTYLHGSWSFSRLAASEFLGDVSGFWRYNNNTPITSNTMSLDTEIDPIIKDIMGQKG